MMKDVVKICFEEQISNEYPHIIHPMSMLAKVTKSSVRLVHLKILDEHGTIDIRYPEIPNVKVQVEYEEGDVVVIQLLYGKIEMPVVIRKWE